MKWRIQKREGRVIANFGIYFLTPLMGINLADVALQDVQILQVTVLKALIISAMFTGMSIFRELGDWANVRK